MRNQIIVLALTLLTGSTFAQNVGIGTNAPDASAKLHIEDPNRGLMVPRVSLVDVTNGLTPVNAPMTGLLVFNTNVGVTGGSGTGFYYWDGTIWKRLQPYNGGDDWHLLGNAGTNPAVNFVGTTDNQDLVFRTNGVENARINTSGNVDIGASLDDARVYARILNTDLTTHYGLYVYNDGGITSGTTYGTRTINYSSTNSTKYGIYNYTNNEGTGARYGLYNYTYLNSASNSSAYGIRNYVSTYGSATQYGIYNYITSSSATGTHYGQRNYVYLNTASTVPNYGEYTYVDYASGERYGEYKSMGTSTAATGTVYGDYNTIAGSGNDVIYGVYSGITNTGTGTHYGLYSNVPGGTNDYAAYFNAGNVVANEVGGDYDFRIESNNRTSALHVDAGADVVRIGSASGSLNGNGGTLTQTYSGTTITIDYVADLDHGSVNGSTFGLGSVEYLVDGANEVFVSDDFSPDVNLVNDLGWENSWDDVYADDFWNVSDIRMKKDIKPMPYGLKEILQLQTISYTLKDDPFGDPKIGLKAQQALTLVPEAVKTHDYKLLDEQKPDEYTKVELNRMVMSYQTLVPVLIKATQEQQEIIDSLEDRIERLEKLLNSQDGSGQN